MFMPCCLACICKILNRYLFTLYNLSRYIKLECKITRKKGKVDKFMKFLRQKETKRKISFLMALAMMVSLLPVSPIAQAAVTKVENLSDNSNVRFAVNSTTATSAVIKVTPANEKEIGRAHV